MYSVHILKYDKNMITNIKPETRRIIVKTAAKEHMSFDDAVDFLIMEGHKAQNDKDYPLIKRGA